MKKMDIGNELVLKLYKTMLKIRLFETAQEKAFKTGQEGFTHLYLGEEAIASGACANLNKDDYITSTHRGHGHLIAIGGDIRKMMAELYGRKTGYCKGKGGSLHMADFSLGMLGANGIVGDGVPIGTGAAYSCKLRGTKQVVISFLGDGAVAQGTFHESLNLGATWNLPIIYLVENNLYMVTKSDRLCKINKKLSLKAPGYGLPGEDIDGMDVISVYKSVKKAVKRAREGNGPTLLNCMTYRYSTHFVGDIELRDKKEIMYWKNKDPIKRIEERMLKEGIINEKEIRSLNDELKTEIDEAIEYAKKSPLPEPEEALEDVYSD